MSTNPFSRLQRLLAPAPLLAGTVVSGAGEQWVVQLPGGAEISVRGQASVGSAVFVRGGVIESTAVVLTDVNIDV